MSRRPRPLTSAADVLARDAVPLPGAPGPVPDGVGSRCREAVARLDLGGLVAAALRTDSPDGRSPGPVTLDAAWLDDVLHPWRVLLDAAAEGTLTLTDRAYLRPDAVRAVTAALGLPVVTREHSSPRLYQLRRHARVAGLVRTRDGVVVLTANGLAAQQDSSFLWSVVAASTVPREAGIARDAVVGLLVHAAAGLGPEGLAPTLATGWRIGARRPTDADVETLTRATRLPLELVDPDAPADDPSTVQRTLARTALTR